MTAVDDIKARFEAADLDGLDRVLDSLGDDDRSAVAAWLGGSKRWCRDLRTRLYEAEDHSAAEREWIYHRMDWMVAITAVAAMAPVAAAERIGWPDLYDFSDSGVIERLHARLRARDAAWVAAFAERASQARDVGWSGEFYSAVLHQALLHHDLPCPSGGTFAQTRMHHDVDELAAEPLMPDVLYAWLDAGFGGDFTGRPDQIATLVERDIVARERVLDIALETLTRATPVSHQRSVAKTFTRLRLTTDDVPGGLPYLLGVISTCTGAVGAALLPLAFELATETHDVDEIVSIVAARTERKQKQMTLT